MRSFRVLCAWAAVAAGGLVWVGCGGDDDTAGAADNQEWKGTIKVMISSPSNSEGYDKPELDAAARASTAAINAEGGIEGYELETLYCNNRNDPNLITSCAREAVRQEVVTMIGLYDQVGGSPKMDILSAADIPDFAEYALLPDEFTDPNSYPVINTVPTNYLGSAYLYQKEGVDKVALISYAQGSNSLANQTATAAMEAYGIDVTKIVTIPVGAPDVTAAVASAVSSGAEGITTLVGAPDTANIVKALKESGEDDIVLANALVSIQSVLPSMNGLADGMLVVSSTPPGGIGAKDAEEFERDFEKYGDDELVVNDQSVEVWLGYRIFQQVAGEIIRSGKELDSKAFKAALDKLSGVNIGPLHNFGFTGEPQVPELPRLFNWSVYLAEIEDDKPVLLQQEPVNVLRDTFIPPDLD